jgi:hypothetical protein
VLDRYVRTQGCYLRDLMGQSPGDRGGCRRGPAGAVVALRTGTLLQVSPHRELALRPIACA